MTTEKVYKQESSKKTEEKRTSVTLVDYVDHDEVVKITIGHICGNNGVIELKICMRLQFDLLNKYTNFQDQ